MSIAYSIAHTEGFNLACCISYECAEQNTQCQNPMLVCRSDLNELMLLASLLHVQAYCAKGLNWLSQNLNIKTNEHVFNEYKP